MISVSILSQNFAECDMSRLCSWILSSTLIHATQHKRDNSKLDPEHKRSNICVLFICFSATPCRFIVTAIRKIHRHKLINECLLTFEETISLFHRGSSTQINYRTVTRINSYITFSHEFCLYRSYLITSCCNRNNSDGKASPTQA